MIIIFNYAVLSLFSCSVLFPSVSLGGISAGPPASAGPPKTAPAERARHCHCHCIQTGFSPSVRRHLRDRAAAKKSEETDELNFCWLLLRRSDARFVAGHFLAQTTTTFSLSLSPLSLSLSLFFSNSLTPPFLPLSLSHHNFFLCCCKEVFLCIFFVLYDTWYRFSMIQFLLLFYLFPISL